MLDIVHAAIVSSCSLEPPIEKPVSESRNGRVIDARRGLTTIRSNGTGGAIRALQSANGGVNRKRRIAEAAFYLTPDAAVAARLTCPTCSFPFRFCHRPLLSGIAECEVSMTHRSMRCFLALPARLNIDPEYVTRSWILRQIMNAEDGRHVYVELSEDAAVRTKVLSMMLEPLTTIIDRYGELICQVTLILGKTPPASARDAAIRDLMADVFDFLMETRPLISKGKVAIAYPLARRAYESLSLMIACHLDESLAKRWIAGKQIGNAEVRRVLGKHPLGEPQEQTQELYNFFSKTTHPNRDQIAQRFLGEKLLNLWFWFGAFICFIYADVLERADPDFHKTLS